MSKPAIIAIIGPSASGKDSLAKELALYINNRKTWGYITSTAHVIVSDTTRPKRANEVEGVDYHFVGDNEFDFKMKGRNYIETYSYGPQNWKYGTPKGELNAEINIGVFSPSGLRGLEKYCSHGYEIVPILMDAPKLVRLWRSIKRDGMIKYEHLRRMSQDSKDFKRIDRILKYDRSLDLRRLKLSVDEKARMVYNILCGWGIIHTI